MADGTAVVGKTRQPATGWRPEKPSVTDPAGFVVRRGVRVAHLRFAEDRYGLLLDCGDGPELWDRARIVPRWLSGLRIEADGRTARTVTICGQLDVEWTLRPGAVTPLRNGPSGCFADLAPVAAAPRDPSWTRRLRARRLERRRLLRAAASALGTDRVIDG